MLKYLPLAAISAILTGNAVAEAPASSQAKPEKQVCRRVGHVGTRVAQTTCMTRADWARVDREAQLRARKTSQDAEDRNSGYREPDMTDPGNIRPN